MENIEFVKAFESLPWLLFGVNWIGNVSECKQVIRDPLAGTLKSIEGETIQFAVLLKQSGIRDLQICPLSESKDFLFFTNLAIPLIYSIFEASTVYPPVFCDLSLAFNQSCRTDRKHERFENDPMYEVGFMGDITALQSIKIDTLPFLLS